MTIKKKELAKQIRKEYKEAREWLRRDWRHTYRMMIDADDGEIWADCFLDVNSWKVYRSKSIRILYHPDVDPDYFPTTVKETEEWYLEAAIRILTEAGHEIEE
mgnify:FL=1